MSLLRIGFPLLLACSASVGHSQAPGELIFAPGSASFSSSHASTIVELNDGSLSGGMVRRQP